MLGKRTEDTPERELQTAAVDLEDDLAGTLGLLRTYRAEDRLEQDMADVACAEAHVEDPLRATMVPTSAGGFAPAPEHDRHDG